MQFELAEKTRGPLPSVTVPLTLLGVFAVIWLLLAIDPSYRQDWLLENVLVMAAIALLVWSYRRLPLGTVSYVGLFLFLVLHEVGAHYTYSEVPYDAWARSALGFSPDQLSGATRNHYDRAVHFLYGLLVTPAVCELLDARAPARGIWRGILPVSFVMSHSVFYELAEWGAAALFGGELGVAYLGTQGDAWDAHKDMLLATLGSIITVLALGRRRPRGAPAQG